LPVEEVRVGAHTATPKAVRRRWWGRQWILLKIQFSVYILLNDVPALFVTCQVYADRDNRLETFRAGHFGNVGPYSFARRMEDQHAEADEGVTEEDGNGEKDHDEEDVDFLADVAVGQSNSEV
jgi:hypothetical protein